jgi:hypothetical protein
MAIYNTRGPARLEPRDLQSQWLSKVSAKQGDSTLFRAARMNRLEQS